jgi:uncharacterized protein
MIDKINRLKTLLEKINSAVVAFSGGLDSTFLLKMAYDQLGDRVVALTALSPTYPEWEMKEAKDLASNIGVRHYLRHSDELSNPLFRQNPRDRCYHCKKELIILCKELAEELGLAHVLEGSNASDLQDHRPGLRAVNEEGVLSPLKEVGMTKEEIRKWSKKIGLPTWSKASQACLASRFPYGSSIEAGRLKQIERAENLLREIGFHQFRVRYHNSVARIEVEKKDLSRFLDEDLRESVVRRFRELGFTYTAVDLQGYRTGSLNEM